MHCAGVCVRTCVRIHKHKIVVACHLQLCVCVGVLYEFDVVELSKRTASICGTESLSTFSNILYANAGIYIFFLRHSTLSTHFILSWNWNQKERMLNCHVTSSHVICNITLVIYLLFSSHFFLKPSIWWNDIFCSVTKLDEFFLFCCKRKAWTMKL